MAFNSNTYRMNKFRRQAWEELQAAREIKARVEAGTAYEWEKPRIAHFVKAARLSMRLYRGAKRIRELHRT